MAVTSRELHDKGAFRRQASKPVPIVRSYRPTSRAPYLLTLLLCVVAVMLTANSVIGWLRTSVDDARYGRPRTMQLSGYVGHDEASGLPSQFIGMNMNRRVVVFEIPGGDVSKTRTLTGPYLFGTGEDLTPIRLRLEAVNGDELQDLVVSVKNEEIIYINDAGSFRLINAEERAALDTSRQ